MFELFEMELFEHLTMCKQMFDVWIVSELETI